VILGQFAPYPFIATAIIAFLVMVRNWSYVKRFAHDFCNILRRFRALVLLRTKYNPTLTRAFAECRYKEPVLQVYKDFVPLRLEQSKGARGIEIRLEEGVAIASIPSLTMENITQAVHTHFTQRISASSTLRKYEKLQKAMDLWATTQVVKATNLDGALSIALSEIANSVLKDEKVG
jgi:hypothetical protein